MNPHFGCKINKKKMLREKSHTFKHTPSLKRGKGEAEISPEVVLTFGSQGSQHFP
jgi:hypothetical protein